VCEVQGREEVDQVLVAHTYNPRYLRG
jgi:hypothetical protein